MISEFYLVIEDFETTLKACNTELVSSPKNDPAQHHRMSSIGHDIIGFSESFVRSHIDATMWSIDSAEYFSKGHKGAPETMLQCIANPSALDPEDIQEIERYLEDGKAKLQAMVRWGESRAHVRQTEATRQLLATYKAYFYFIRAFQDAGYRMLMCINDQRPGRGSSMHACIKKDDTPIHKTISSIPGYIDWFIRFKHWRDLIKYGVGASLSGPQWDVGLHFTRITPEGGLEISADPKKAFRIGDLINSIENSKRLTDAIRIEATRRA